MWGVGGVRTAACGWCVLCYVWLAAVQGHEAWQLWAGCLDCPLPPSPSAVLPSTHPPDLLQAQVPAFASYSASDAAGGAAAAAPKAAASSPPPPPPKAAAPAAPSTPKAAAPSPPPRPAAAAGKIFSVRVGCACLLDQSADRFGGTQQGPSRAQQQSKQQPHTSPGGRSVSSVADRFPCCRTFLWHALCVVLCCAVL